MRIVAGLVPLLLALFPAAPAPAPPEPAFPAGTAGQFVALDLRTGRSFHVDPAGCARRFSPYSTFKIPNSLIGLETGVVAGPDEKLRWDAAKYPVPGDAPRDYARVWRRDLELRTALANSIVWFYRELATRIGERRMKVWLGTFAYGNQDVSGGIDRFWLGSSLRISPDEQVAFLARLQHGGFPVSRTHLEAVQAILTQDSTPACRLVAKTGSSGTGEGWLVGWVLRGDGGCAFALHLQARSHDAMAQARPLVARELLERAGYLPR